MSITFTIKKATFLEESKTDVLTDKDGNVIQLLPRDDCKVIEVEVKSHSAEEEIWR